jgi:hypothetical protein
MTSVDGTSVAALYNLNDPDVVTNAFSAFLIRPPNRAASRIPNSDSGPEIP